MQNDLIYGALGNKNCQAIVPKVADKIKNFQNGLLYLTLTTNDESYFETAIGKDIPEKYCIYMSKGWLIQEDIFNAAHESSCTPIFFERGSYDNNMADMVRHIKSYCDDWDNEVEVEICGVATEIGVLSLVLTLRTFCPYIKITVNSDCCAGVTKKTHKSALSVMNLCGVNVEGSEDYNKLKWEDRETIQRNEQVLD